MKVLAGGALLALAAWPAAGREPAQIYNVYASAPEGDPAAIEVVQGRVAALEACGIAGTWDQTMRYEGLSPNLLFALTGPHANLSAARAELDRARACGIAGYTRRATFLGGE